MDAKAIRASMKELEGAGSTERLLEILQTLEKRFRPTESLLRETKVGVAVNKLRTHSDPRVSQLVKKLVGTWRESVQQQKSARLKTSATPGPATPTSPAPSQTSPEFKSDNPRDAKSDGVDTAIYDDSVRNSCVQVTYNALAFDSDQPPQKILDAAKGVERAVYIAEKGTSPNYRKKLRSLFLNLKDPKNPMLRRQVILGTISGERLRNMRPQEMANDELKKEMEAIGKQNLFNAQGAKETRSVTDRFTCGKCKQKKVSYYQMQTRSADEPLTTFCTCENCGNRWKFS